jgi:hypothetical protein
MTTLKDHGYWIRYIPTQRPDGVPDNIMFSKRESDGVDWYEYNHSPVHFQPDGVKLVVRQFEGSISWEVGQSNRDVTHLFPPDGSMIMEVLNDAVTDEKWFLGRILQNGMLFEKPVPPPPPATDQAYLSSSVADRASGWWIYHGARSHQLCTAY